MTDYDRDQIRAFLLDRYGSYFGGATDAPSLSFDLQQALSEDRPGRQYEAWHLIEFAFVDDCRAEGVGVMEACRRVCGRLPAVHRSKDKPRSVYTLYYEFKRERELYVRKKAFADALLTEHLDEAIEQCFRLSKITDIEREFRDW